MRKTQTDKWSIIQVRKPQNGNDLLNRGGDLLPELFFCYNITRPIRVIAGKANLALMAVDLCIWKWSMFCNIPTFDCCLKWFIRLVKPAVCWERRSHLGEWRNISPTENVASGCTFREIWNVLVVLVIEKCEMYCLSCRPIITLLYKLKHGQPNSCMALLLVFDVTWTCIRIIKPSRNYSRDE